METWRRTDYTNTRGITEVQHSHRYDKKQTLTEGERDNDIHASKERERDKRTC